MSFLQVLLLCIGVVLSSAQASVKAIPRACSTPETSQYPFCNASLPLQSRVDDLISRLHVEEYGPLLTARQSPGGGVERLGLPEYNWGANCIHGVQSRCAGDVCPSSFPSPIALGASFNSTLWRLMGSVIGIELRALWLAGVGENHDDGLPHLGLDCWSPSINLIRDPRWGRAQEVPGEDPLLTGLYSAAVTEGLQNGEDSRYLQAISTVKHFFSYSFEGLPGSSLTRHSFSANVSKFDLKAYYLPAFQLTIEQGGALGVMCSYNAINGIPACAHPALQAIIREDWGFEGYITSDSDAIYDIYANHHYVGSAAEAVVAALEAGTDVDSNLQHDHKETGSPYMDQIENAIQAGHLSNETVLQALNHTLSLRFRLGLFDPPASQPYWNYSLSLVNTESSKQLSLEGSRQGLVLLKNDNNTLPLKAGISIGIIGPHANASGILASNYKGQLCPRYGDLSCIQGLTQALGAYQNVTSVTACNVSSGSEKLVDEAVEDIVKAGVDIIVLAIGLDGSIENEGKDRENISLPDIQSYLAKKVMELSQPVVAIVFNGGAVGLDVLKMGASAIVEAFYPGIFGARAIAELLFGKYSPSAKLPYTIYPESYAQEINITDMSLRSSPGRTYLFYQREALWPFGFGLTYSTFSFRLYQSTLYLDNVKNENATLDVGVTNTGTVTGADVVFIFMKPPPALQEQGFSSFAFRGLNMKLIAFRRTQDLQRNERQALHITLDVNDILVIDENGTSWSIPQRYQAIVTNGVETIGTATVVLNGRTKIVEELPDIF